MKIYTIVIQLENAAFEPAGGFNPEEAAAAEVGRILDEIGEYINTRGALPVKKLLDVNGNTAGAAGYNAAGSAFYHPPGAPE